MVGGDLLFWLFYCLKSQSGPKLISLEGSEAVFIISVWNCDCGMLDFVEVGKLTALSPAIVVYFWSFRLSNVPSCY